jgi:hypothetical protein
MIVALTTSRIVIWRATRNWRRSAGSIITVLVTPATADHLTALLSGGQGRAFKHGALLHTRAATVPTSSCGWFPRQRDGWMWDLTIPGACNSEQSAVTAGISHAPFRIKIASIPNGTR